MDRDIRETPATYALNLAIGFAAGLTSDLGLKAALLIAPTVYYSLQLYQAPSEEFEHDVTIITDQLSQVGVGFASGEALTYGFFKRGRD
jgi:hypothetical protein